MTRRSKGLDRAAHRALVARPGASGPASDEDLSWLSDTFRKHGAIAKELAALYARHDGFTGEGALLYDYVWIPLRVSRERYEDLLKGEDVGDFFLPSWLPAFTNFGGSYLVVDTRSPSGRIIECEYGEYPRLYLPSLTAAFELSTETVGTEDDAYWKFFKARFPKLPGNTTEAGKI